jgi:hypothetical protein
MKIITRISLLCMFSVMMMSCANMDKVKNAPQNAGINKVYKQDFEFVKAATLASMQTLNINIKETSQADDVFTITFTKSLSALSWGEVGRVLVAKNDDNKTTIYVYSAKRATYEFASSNQADFAYNIFNGIDDILKQTAE